MPAKNNVSILENSSKKHDLNVWNWFWEGVSATTVGDFWVGKCIHDFVKHWDY